VITFLLVVISAAACLPVMLADPVAGVACIVAASHIVTKIDMWRGK